MTELPGTRSLKVAAYERIQRMLVDREFAPGQHLPEPIIAAQLGISRGPVREALQQLERDGWVDIRPRHGAYVHNPTQAEVDEFFEVRLLLEREATRMAAMRNSERARLLLQPILDSATASLDAGESEPRLTNLNQEFHRAIMSLAGNVLMARIATTVTDRSQWFVRAIVGDISHRAWKEHRAIAEAIQAGAADRAVVLMDEHIRWSRQLFTGAAAATSSTGDADC